MTSGSLVYDADCGFCTRSAEWLTRHGSCAVVPWQSLDLAELGLSEEQVTTAAYWLDSAGRPTAHGARAISAALQSGATGWRLIGRAIDARPVRPLAARVYGLVATYRYRLPGGTNACRIDTPR